MGRASAGDMTLTDPAAESGNGGKQPFASSRAGSAGPVVAETVAGHERLDATHVPYRGGAQATTDTLAGTVDFFVPTWPPVVPLVREGRLRALRISAPARLPEAPDVPLCTEFHAP